jgi:AbrB family looped-hinge helix DNA binding protein
VTYRPRRISARPHRIAASSLGEGLTSENLRDGGSSSIVSIVPESASWFVLYTERVCTKVTKQGRVSIPAVIRRQLHIGPGRRLEWVVEGANTRVIPLPADPVRAFRGSGKRGMVKRLLEERGNDRRREHGDAS